MKKVLFALSGILLALMSFSQKNNAPSGLLCELLSHPELSVITTPAPSFSWIVNSQSNNASQTSYQIIVSNSEKDLYNLEDVLWDSGKVTSNKSSNVEYSGKPLSDNSNYHWMVRTWDENSNASDWSEPQNFKTGDFNVIRLWPGESKWVQIEDENGVPIWTFENRHPIRYHKVNVVNKSQRDNVFFSILGGQHLQYQKLITVGKRIIQQHLMIQFGFILERKQLVTPLTNNLAVAYYLRNISSL